MNEKMYHLIILRTYIGKTKIPVRKVYLTGYPMTHKQCMVLKSKFSPYEQSMITVEEAKDRPDID